MASALMSLSESLQVSMITQNSKSYTNQKNQAASSNENFQGIGFGVQVLLVSALFGIEMVVAFEQIYVILFHQFLGVPVSLLSINGIVCGCISMTCLPVMGWCSDRGKNPKRRKLFSLFIGLCMFLCGLLLLAAGGLIKLSAAGSLVTNNNKTNLFVNFEFTTTSSSLQTIELREAFYNELSTSSATVFPLKNVSDEMFDQGIHNNETQSEISTTAVLSIMGFSFIDIGFDTSISITRAFILENVPTFQHTRLLVLATVAASMAGTTFSLIGCFDFPGLLGNLFHAEGVAVTLVFYCTLLFCLVVTGYSFTIITGIVLHKRSLGKKSASHNGYTKFENTSSAHADKKFSPRLKILSEKATKNTASNARRSYIADILHTEEGDLSTKPLLVENSYRGSNYWAMSISTSSIAHACDLQEARLPYNEDKQLDSSKNSSCHNETPLNDGDGDRSNISQQHEKCAEFHQNNSDQESTEHKSDDCRETSSIIAIKQCCSMTMSCGRAPLGEFREKQLNKHNSDNQKSDQPKQDNKLRMNKRLTILCISCFLTFGGMISFIVYISNALNIGILHGDPTSKPGTEAYDSYQSGLRTAALGNLVLYVTYMVISVNNTRILKLIGAKGQYVGCHTFLIITLTVLLLTKRVEVYFVFMVSCGGLRTCVFTLPFVLATKFTQDENAKGDNTSGKELTNLGKVTALIGFMFPAHYILLSSFMGPLMDATNVWAPLIYSLGCCSLSLLIFCSLFLVKN